MDESIYNGEEVSRRGAEAQREALKKIAKHLDEINKEIKNIKFITCECVNVEYAETPKVHIPERIFLSLFGEFCYEKTLYPNFRIFTTLNNVEVFALIPPRELGIKTKTITTEVEV